ncbi:MAG TPA: SET domain-containing protein-lysine N-methyltransferase [Micavibrio sp.]|nr:SET domain-containing protein-lysine N-methyltransferase [Micavibrio sp.]
MKNNTAKNMMDWQAKSAANRVETMVGAQIAWMEIDEEKGRGMFALRDFKKGEILETAPVIPVAKENVVESGEAPDGYLLDWDGHYENEEYCMPLGYIMMYNHSKEPNIMLDQDYDKYTMQAIAIRDIRKGEELCWDYNVDELWFDEA